jgi:arylsulfatase A-like enzyme
VLITTDQHRADSIGAYGNTICQTPNIDRLASEGTRFTACRTQNPYCQPSRATILTGTYPTTHGVTSNGMDLSDEGLAMSVAAQLGAAGYSTALLGKAHFATTYPLVPNDKIESVAGSALVDEDWNGPYAGFGHVELLLFGHMMRVAPLMGNWNWCFGPPPFGLHYARWLYRDGRKQGNERMRLMTPEGAGAKWDHTQTWTSAVAEEDHPTTWVADRAVDFIRKADGPFFTWVSFTDPHHPMDAPTPWGDMYSAADVADILPPIVAGEHETKPFIHKAWTQGARGREMEWANPGGATLTREELATMTAGYYGMVSQLDHNIGRVLAALDERGLAEDTLVVMTTDHGELLGDHQMVFKGPLHYEGLLRLPLVVRGPGFDAGAVVDDPVGTIDLVPTFLEAAGAPVPDHVEGVTLTSLGREHVLTENDHNMVISMPLRTLTTRRYKVTRYEAIEGVGELYDFDDDPGEFVNRWDDPAYATIRSDLLSTMDDVMNHTTNAGPMVGVVA